MKMFGEYLRGLRESKKLPLRKVAAFLDIDTSVLSKIERGERTLNDELLCKISDFFGLDEEHLKTEYWGEEIARKVYQMENVSSVLKVAEKKAEYLKSQSYSQGNLQF